MPVQYLSIDLMLFCNNFLPFKTVWMSGLLCYSVNILLIFLKIDFLSQDFIVNWALPSDHVIWAKGKVFWKHDPEVVVSNPARDYFFSFSLMCHLVGPSLRSIFLKNVKIKSSAGWKEKRLKMVPIQPHKYKTLVDKSGCTLVGLKRSSNDVSR